MSDSGIEFSNTESDDIQEFADELLATFRFSDLRRCREDCNVELASGSFPIKKFEAEIRMLGKRNIPTTEVEAADCLKFAFYLAGEDRRENEPLQRMIGFSLASLETHGATDGLRSALIEAIKLTEEDTAAVAGILANVRAWLGPNKWVFPG